MSNLVACDYSEAMQRVGGDFALLSQVLVIFLDEMPKMKAAIRKYAEEGNSRLLWNESHKMKGAASHKSKHLLKIMIFPRLLAC